MFVRPYGVEVGSPIVKRLAAVGQFWAMVTRRSLAGLGATSVTSRHVFIATTKIGAPMSFDPLGAARQTSLGRFNFLPKGL
jgi:hypothetical protein